MKKTTKTLGRPRSFDTDQALDSAMHVFWKKGYEGTSLTDLTRAMGINRPSLYAAFGDKESLFRKVLERYSQGPARYVQAANLEASARKVVEKLLYGALELMSQPGNPQGCLMVHGALTGGKATSKVRRIMAEHHAQAEDGLRRRLRRAVSEGDLPANADPDTLTRFVVTVIQGMSVQAANGASRAQLEKVARQSLQGWPSRVPAIKQAASD